MSMAKIGENGVQEFFEELMFGYTYQETRSNIADITKDVDDNVLQDAMQSSLNMVAMGVMMKMINAMESFIETIFNIAKALILALVGSQFVQNAMKRLSGGLKGIGVLKRMGFFASGHSDRIQVAQLVNDMSNNHLNAQKTVQSETQIYQSVQQTKAYAVQKESHHMNFADKLSDRYTKTFLPKLLTKSFTSKDTADIKKVFGRDSASQMDYEDLNKIADFMFVTDSNGEVSGLSDIMISLVNGMGYIHNK